MSDTPTPQVTFDPSTAESVIRHLDKMLAAYPDRPHPVLTEAAAQLRAAVRELADERADNAWLRGRIEDLELDAVRDAP